MFKLGAFDDMDDQLGGLGCCCDKQLGALTSAAKLKKSGKGKKRKASTAAAGGAVIPVQVSRVQPGQSLLTKGQKLRAAGVAVPTKGQRLRAAGYDVPTVGQKRRAAAAASMMNPGVVDMPTDGSAMTATSSSGVTPPPADQQQPAQQPATATSTTTDYDDAAFDAGDDPSNQFTEGSDYDEADDFSDDGSYPIELVDAGEGDYGDGSDTAEYDDDAGDTTEFDDDEDADEAGGGQCTVNPDGSRNCPDRAGFPAVRGGGVFDTPDDDQYAILDQISSADLTQADAEAGAYIAPTGAFATHLIEAAYGPDFLLPPWVVGGNSNFTAIPSAEGAWFQLTPTTAGFWPQQWYPTDYSPDFGQPPSDVGPLVVVQHAAGSELLAAPAVSGGMVAPGMGQMLQGLGLLSGPSAADKIEKFGGQVSDIFGRITGALRGKQSSSAAAVANPSANWFPGTTAILLAGGAAVAATYLLNKPKRRRK
jgi:hypothetical protein